MTDGKLIRLGQRDLARERLLAATGELLASRGFAALDAGELARLAGVPRRRLFSLFKGLPGLVRAWASEGGFWPTATELAAGEEPRLRGLPSHALLAEFNIRLLRALRGRPRTLDILAWELLERHELCRELEQPRVRCALEFFELMRDDPPPDIDFSAVVLLLAGAVVFLALRSRRPGVIGGLDLWSPEDALRLERGLAQLAAGQLAGD